MHNRQPKPNAPPPTASTPFPDPIPGIIPFGTVTLFAGAPGVGKTTMLAEWCRRWRDGLTICGHATTRPTAFCYITADRPWSEYVPMFAAAGFGDIPHYALADDTTRSLADLRDPKKVAEVFSRTLDQLQIPPGAHVFVDPISPLFIVGDPNKQRDVAVSMLGFSRRCTEYQINLTCTVHFGKQKSDPRQRYTRPQDRIAGSTSFAGFSCTQIYFCDPEPPQQPYSLLGWNPRHHPAEDFKFVRDDAGLFVPFHEELVADDTAEQVLGCLPPNGEDIPVNTLVVAVKVHHNLSRRAVYLALDALIRQRRVLRMGRGKYRRIQPS